MRFLTALLFSLVLAVTSVTTAVARGQEPLGLTLTLCTEEGAVAVTLDANGNPVSAHEHHCPDCLSAVVAMDMPATASLPARPISRAVAVAFMASISAPGLVRHGTRARAPPALLV